MDTLVMSARCALLIVVTGAFAALWAGDHPDKIAVIDRTGKAPVPTRGTNSKSRINVYEPSSDETTFLNAPLPKDLPSGIYLVVDHLGRSEKRRVLRPIEQPGVAALNHYSIEVNGLRWHFIRIDGPIEDRTASHSTIIAR